jgi:hypothetical protein
MPKEFWIYSGSEGDLDIMIRAEAKKQLLEEKKKIGEGNAVLTDDEIETKIGEIGVNMKRKLVPYKTKRKEEVKGVRAALEEKKAEELKALEELELAQNKKVYEANSACFRIEDESDNCYEELVKKRKEMEGLGTGNAKELMKLEIQRLEDRRSKIDENIAAAGAKITDEQCKLEVIRENIKLKKREIPTAKVEDKARAEYAIPHNWRMKELKSVAGKLWDAKKAQKDLQQGVNEAIIKIEAVTDRFRKAKEVHRDLQQKVNKEIESSVNKIFRGSVKSSDSPTPENPVNSINAPNTPAVPGGFPSSPGGEFARGG